jgi:hypothetical protein
MAIDALPHKPSLGGQALRIFHLTMTLPAGNLAVDMTLMIKQHMFRDIINFHPGGRCLGVEITMFHFNPRVIGNDVIVAVQAFLYRRDSWMVGIGHIGVAVLALYLLYTAVDIVTERNRLFRTNIGLEQAIVYINKPTCKNQNEQYQICGYNIFAQRLFPF